MEHVGDLFDRNLLPCGRVVRGTYKSVRTASNRFQILVANVHHEDIARRDPNLFCWSATKQTDQIRKEGGRAGDRERGCVYYKSPERGWCLKIGSEKVERMRSPRGICAAPSENLQVIRPQNFVF